MQVVNSTISGNGSSVTRYGGAVENAGNLDLKHVTFAFNRALFGGGIFNNGRLALQNSIIAKNGRDDCFLPHFMRSNDYNLDGDGSCFLHKPSDVVGVDPGLRELKNNGGLTKTHGLYPWSPAFDSAVGIDTIKTDQRGVMRPQGVAVDRGAVEDVRFTVPPLVYPLLGR